MLGIIKNTFYIIVSILKYILHNNKNTFVNKINFIYSRHRSSTVNKLPSESMSFITEVICKFIFTDVHMRNNCRPNRALDKLVKNN